MEGKLEMVKPYICKVGARKRKIGVRETSRKRGGRKSYMKNDLSLPAFLIHTCHNNEQ